MQTNLTFKISGRSVVDIAREKVMEGRWRSGLKLLECVNECTHEMAVLVLNGEKVFSGINSVRYINETRKRKAEYQKRFNFKFEHIVHDKKSNRYFVPYAVVTSWCQEDYDHRHTHDNRYVRSDDKTMRSIFYMDDRVNDTARVLDCQFGDEVKGGCVLWREIVDPPMWIDFFDGSYTEGWQTALYTYQLNGNYLEERGGSQLRHVRNKAESYNKQIIDNAVEDLVEDHESDDYSKTVDLIGPEDKKSRLASLAHSGLVPGLAEMMGIPDLAVAQQATLDYITGKQDTSSLPIPEDSYYSKHGYITTDGNFYPCNFHAHAALAKRIFEHLLNDKTEYIDYEKAADAAGFIRLSRSMFDNTPSAFVYRTPTDAQEVAFRGWCRAQNVELELLVTRRQHDEP